MADTWTPISGYTPQDYTDTMVFEMSSETKKVETIMGQALVAGEENSQYIKFVLPRYWDGIDISGKTFSVEYALSGQYYGTSEAVNAEISAEQVRFGWVVPEEACCISGKLLFVLRIESADYILKSQIVEVSVYKSINVEDVVPEPTREAWYREFEARVNVAIADAEAALEAAQTAQTAAETAAQNAQTAEDNAEAAAAAAQIRYGSPLTAQTAEDMIDENRVYVYTGSETGYTAGNWYYYDGTAWTSGGVYNGTGINTDTTLTQAGMAADAKAVGDELSTIKEDLSDLEKDVSAVSKSLITEQSYTLTAPESLTVPESISEQSVDFDLIGSVSDDKIITNKTAVGITPWSAVGGITSFNKDNDTFENIDGTYIYILFHVTLVTASEFKLSGSGVSNVYKVDGTSLGDKTIPESGWYYIRTTNGFSTLWITADSLTIDYMVGIDSGELESNYPNITWDIDTVIANFPASKYGTLGAGETYVPQSADGSMTITHNGTTTTYTGTTVTATVRPEDVIASTVGSVTFALTEAVKLVKTVNNIAPDENGNIDIGSVDADGVPQIALMMCKNKNLVYKGEADDAKITGLTPSVNDAYLYRTTKIHGLYKEPVCDGDILYWNGVDWCTLRLTPSTFDNYENERYYDVVIIGGGAGGMGAAYALKDSGYKICVVESLDSLGGTHVNAGVCELLSSPVPEYFKAIVKSIYNQNQNLVMINGNRQYGSASEDTFDKLWRGGFITLGGNRTNGFSTNPFALAKRYYDDLVNAGVDVLLGTEFLEASATSNGTVENITVKNNHTGKVERIWGLYFIDSSSFASLCKYGKTMGVDYYQGTDDRARFNESAIPEDYVASIKSVNLAEAGYMYEETTEEYDAPKHKITDAFAVSQARWLYPNDIGKVIRVMSTENSCRITRYIFDPDYGANYKYALFQAKERTKDHFEKYFGARSQHRYIKPMPLLAMRETTRVKCDSMLVQDDITILATSQNYKDNRYVALGSWGFDLHNASGVDRTALPQAKELVGLPYECLIPSAYKNVLVASKCFGASHIAAGYFRLGKTCMCIGWAAGNAVKLAIADGYLDDLRNVDIDELQSAIGIGDMLADIETYFTLT